MEKPLLQNETNGTNGTSNGHVKEKEEDLNIGQKSKIETASDAIKSTASALTNGLNGLKVN